jgi:membrane-bound lytic murein transglycosylase D
MRVLPIRAARVVAPTPETTNPMTSPIKQRPRLRAARALLVLAVPAFILAGCAAPGGLAPPEPEVSTPSPAPTPTPQARAPEPVTAAPAPVAAASGAPSEPQGDATAVVVDPLRPEVRLDLNDRSARIDLWERVRNGFAMPDIDSALVRDRERWYAARPDYVQRMTDRGSRYLFHIVEELDRRGMPTELALLPFIESAYNPQAMSTAKASGMWQFIPSTGRDFLLRQNVFRDDRRDVLASTRAALDYLQKLHGMFGDWHLALAAYNWGEGSVQRAIARNQRAGLATDYASLKMPNETQLYVPKLQAVKNIVARPHDFGLTLPQLSDHPYFLSVGIDRDIDVALAVQLAGMSLEEFQTLNPQMNKPVILAAGTPQILLTYDSANRFVRQLPQHRGPLATWTAWVAPKTMRTAEAAKQVGVSEEQLREINKIPSRMLVKAGSTLVVPRTQGRHADVSPQVADNAVIALAPDLPSQRKVTLQAGRRDTVASVARRYRVSPAQVAQWNDVTPTASFKAGQTIVVYVPNAKRVAKTVRAAQAPLKSQGSKSAASTGAGARFKAEKVAGKGGTNVAHN